MTKAPIILLVIALTIGSFIWGGYVHSLLVPERIIVIPPIEKVVLGEPEIVEAPRFIRQIVYEEKPVERVVYRTATRTLYTDYQPYPDVNLPTAEWVFNKLASMRGGHEYVIDHPWMFDFKARGFGDIEQHKVWVTDYLKVESFMRAMHTRLLELEGLNQYQDEGDDEGETAPSPLEGEGEPDWDRGGKPGKGGKK